MSYREKLMAVPTYQVISAALVAATLRAAQAETEIARLEAVVKQQQLEIEALEPYEDET